MRRKASQTMQKQATSRAETQKTVIAIVALLFVLIVFWLSAVPAMNWYERSGQASLLREARALWLDGRHENYEFDYMMTCLCDEAMPHPVTVSIRGGKFFRAYGRDGGETVRPPSGQAALPTIDEIFDVVASILDRHPRRLEIAYDPVYAYPVEVRADFDGDTSGDEVGYYLSRFRPDESDP